MTYAEARSPISYFSPNGDFVCVCVCDFLPRLYHLPHTLTLFHPSFHSYIHSIIRHSSPTNVVSRSLLGPTSSEVATSGKEEVGQRKETKNLDGLKALVGGGGAGGTRAECRTVPGSNPPKREGKPSRFRSGQNQRFKTVTFLVVVAKDFLFFFFQHFENPT